MAVALRDAPWMPLALGVALVSAANVLLPLQDALTKQLVQSLPVTEVVFVRGLTVFVATLLIGRRRLVSRFVRSPLKGVMAVRGLVVLGGWITFGLAVRDLPLAQAVTLYFVSPLLVSVAAIPLLGERATGLQWVAIAAGFCGVVLATGLTDFEVSAAVWIGLLSAGFWATSMLMLRGLTRGEDTLLQVAVANGVFVLATLPPLVVRGPMAATDEVLLMMGAGLIGGLGQFCFYESARFLVVPVLATLEYTALLSAFALGYLMFGEVPGLTIWAGAGLVLVSGVLVVLAERGRPVVPPLARECPLPLPSAPEETPMTDLHDAVVAFVARTRFPFAGQTTWPDDYVTVVNAPARTRAVPTPSGDHYPDIAIVDGTGRLREAGEVEMTVDPAKVPLWRAVSEATDTDTPTKVRHFFMYVPAGQEAAAQALLDENGISYAGVRGFTVGEDGRMTIVPFVTAGDPYDDQVTSSAA